MVAVLIAIYLFATLGALLQLLSQALSDRLVLLLHHRTTWSRLDSGTLLGAGILGTRSLGTRSTAAGDDNRRCHEYEHMVSHLNLHDEDHTQVGDVLILRSYCARTRAVIGSPHQRLWPIGNLPRGHHCGVSAVGPLWVKSRHCYASERCLLYPKKRTFASWGARLCPARAAFTCNLKGEPESQ